MAFPNAQNNQSGAIPVYGGSSVLDSTGAYVIPLDSLEKTYAYDGGGVLQTISVTYNGNTFVQTYTYTGGNVTTVSAWVKQ